MLKKEITYQDFDGNDVTGEYMFNLNEVEALEFQWSRPGGLASIIDTIVRTKDVGTLVSLFKELIRKSYGVRVGDQFVKNDEVWNQFAQTNAFPTLFMLLATNDEEGAAFINGIIPQQKTKETPATIASLKK